MSYQVLARKWRPRTFPAMAGQEHVLRALINGLDSERLHHAYLFTGTRGVGKTTVARILAKCLNCEGRGITSEPCGECDSCREIDEGRFVDLIEVDAASRTKVEDTRELLDNVQYAPSRGRYKVYLIDEVHMLSAHSFNALLKTLEEPPAHVKFLLATTDPQKLPVTILSRCLQFNLKRLPASLITEHLNKVLEAEGIEVETAAVQRLAQAADGSMRDALSLLDQAIAFGAGGLSDEDVRAMLGSIERDYVFELLEALAAADGQALLQAVDRLSERAPDFGDALGELMGTLHRLALMQTVPQAETDQADPDAERLARLSERLSPEDVQLYYQIGLNGRRDLQWAPEPQVGFEMTMMRMLAFKPAEAASGGEQSAGAGAPASAAQSPTQAQAARDATRTEASTDQPAPAVTDAEPPPARAPANPRPAAPAAGGDDEAWWRTVRALNLGGMAHALALHCQWAGREGHRVKLRLGAGHDHLLNRSMSQRLEAALGEHLGEPIELDIEVGEVSARTPAEFMAEADAQRHEEAQSSIHNDPNVSALRDAFDAELVPDSIEPLN